MAQNGGYYIDGEHREFKAPHVWFGGALHRVPEMWIYLDGDWRFLYAEEPQDFAAVDMSYCDPGATPPSSRANKFRNALSWTNSATDHPVEIWRDGSLYQTVGAGATNYTDDLASPGAHTYKLRYNRGALQYSTFTAEITVVNATNPCGL